MRKLNPDEPRLMIDFASYSTRPDKCVLAFNAAKLTCDAKDIVYDTTGLKLMVDMDEETTMRRLCQTFNILTYAKCYDDYMQTVNVVTVLNTTTFLEGDRCYGSTEHTKAT